MSCVNITFLLCYIIFKYEFSLTLAYESLKLIFLSHIIIFGLTWSWKVNICTIFNVISLCVLHHCNVPKTRPWSHDSCAPERFVKRKTPASIAVTDDGDRHFTLIVLALFVMFHTFGWSPSPSSSSLYYIDMVPGVTHDSDISLRVVEYYNYYICDVEPMNWTDSLWVLFLILFYSIYLIVILHSWTSKQSTYGKSKKKNKRNVYWSFISPKPRCDATMTDVTFPLFCM